MWPDQAFPDWPTSLSLLAWLASDQVLPPTFREPISLGTQWLLATYSEAIPESPEIGHDTTLRAWPWVKGTHAWVEPTAMAAMALKATGMASHARLKEAEQVLQDRELPDGGYNYGNTIILGQVLRPHVQPTGLVLLSLQNHPEFDRDKSRAYLRATLPAIDSLESYAWGSLGLIAAGDPPEPLQAAAERRWRQRSRSRMGLKQSALLGILLRPHFFLNLVLGRSHEPIVG